MNPGRQNWSEVVSRREGPGGEGLCLFTPLSLEPRIAPDIINSRYSTCEEMNEDCLNLIISHSRKKGCW